jgi:predicted ATPase
MEYQSEIRESEITALEDKVSGNKYGAYLRRMVLRKVRGFSDQAVSFDFPVTAIVGPNGGGKTTILGAAAILYKSVPPSRFFAKSGEYDASMSDWAIEYEVIDRSINPRLPIQRTASFKKRKWNRKAVSRHALLFGVTRTVPATERRELIKATGNGFRASRSEELSTEVIDAVEAILGKDMAGCSRLNVDKTGRVTLFAASTSDGQAYSEFHFGAGEASVIRIVAGLAAAPDNAIILIEEIENGLHPVATRRLVEHLITVARDKSCQVIFTTHSNEALAPLPTKAIWAAFNGEVLQGKLDVRALRTITGQIDASLAVFVEDEFAERLVGMAMRYHGGIDVPAVRVHAMGGAEPAIQVNVQHNADPTSKFPSICLVDGDARNREDSARRVWALPGNTPPEAHVLEYVLTNLDSLAARLTVSMQLPANLQERVKTVVRERARTNRDRHVIFEQIGEDLDFTAGLTVSNAFLALWAQENADEIQALFAPFHDLVPKVAVEGQPRRSSN